MAWMNSGIRLGVVSVSLILAACASTGSGGSWVVIGESPDDNILHELDRDSIQRQGTVVTFRDKKTIRNPSKENFAKLPPHKVSLNTWEINCSSRQYRILATELQDKSGKAVYQQNFTGVESQKMAISKGSPAEQQAKMVCGH